jgi:predicted RecB family nuclease
MNYYEIDGEKYPRVTAILNIIHRPELERWRGELGNVEADRIRDDAAQMGTSLHHICRLFNRDQSFEIPPTSQLGRMFDAYRQWFETVIDTVVETEHLVANKKFGYAGTFDLLALLKGDVTPSVIDLKTSKDFWPTMALQLAAYREALLEEGKEVDRRLVVRIDKLETGKLEVKEYTQHARDFNAFLAALSLFRYFEK